MRLLINYDLHRNVVQNELPDLKENLKKLWD